MTATGGVLTLQGDLLPGGESPTDLRSITVDAIDGVNDTAVVLADVSAATVCPFSAAALTDFLPIAQVSVHMGRVDGVDVNDLFAKVCSRIPTPSSSPLTSCVHRICVWSASCSTPPTP